MLDRESIKSLAALGEYSALGIQMVTTIGVFGVLGWWLDGKWNTEPIFLLVGCMIGVAGGIYLFIRAVQKINKKWERLEKEKNTKHNKFDKS